MSVAALIRSMAAAGAPAEAIALAVEAVESAEGQLAAQRVAARDRKRKQRAALSCDGHGTVSGQDGDSHAAAPLPLALPPQTPLSHTPTPPDVTTRGRGGSSKPNGFARFWEAYPNKIAKAKAETAYARALAKIPGHDPPAVILAGVERAKASRAWAEGYIPHPTTWLNGGCWEDQPAEVIPLNGRSHERPHHDAKYAARQDNLAAHERGADLAARFHGEP